MKNKNKSILLGIIGGFIAGIIGAVFVQLLTPQMPLSQEIEDKISFGLSEIDAKLKLSKEEILKNTPLTLDKKITQTVKNISPSVVSIIIKKDLVVYRTDPWGFFRSSIGSIQQKIGGGTGFFVSKDGKIITNKHVVSDTDAIYTVITSDNNEYNASVVAVDPRNDIAIIEINPDQLESIPSFEPLSFIDNEDEIELGQFAIATGNALAEFENSVSLGIVSGKNRTINDAAVGLSGLIQTDAAINPGNSGGPLLNLDGKVMGMNTLIIGDSEGVGFAIALTKSRVDYILKSIKDSGEIKRVFLGINYIPISKGIQQEFDLGSDSGIYIIDKPGSVLENSNAQKAGIEPGDIIVKINNKLINEKNTLPNILDNKIPGEKLSLELMKKSGETKIIELELGEI